MSFGDDFVNAVLRIVERHSAGRKNTRAGMVTAWDPKKHLSKVMFQPEQHETGWMPTHAMSAGNGFGHMTGLTPGDGKTTGDQVQVNYQEGDFETGAIVARLHSKIDQPPVVLSGEDLISTPHGSSIKHAQDGSVTTTDKGGSIIKQDGSANVSVTSAKTVKIDATDTSHFNVPTDKILYLGGDGSTGTYDFVQTVSGPSINVKARIG